MLRLSAYITNLTSNTYISNNPTSSHYISDPSYIHSHFINSTFYRLRTADKMADNAPAYKEVVNPAHFSSLSTTYALQTGNSTTDLLNLILPHIHSLKPIDSSSVIHDNAAGPGSAAAAILAFGDKEKWPKEILVTDNNEDMIKTATSTFEDVPGIKCQVLDSQNLQGLQDGHFTHSIMNMSLFLLPDTVKAMARIHSTLAPTGLAIFTTWSRFGASHIIHSAQKAIRPDLPLMPIPGPQFASLDYLAESAEKAGFEKSKIETFNKDLKVVEGKWLDGLKGFFNWSPLVKMARKGWSEEEEGRWMGEIEKGIQREIEEYGGVCFEGAVLIARK